MTRRERLERKAEKRREWAEGRRKKADAHYQASTAATAGIPFGQPILVGHHSEKRHRAALERSANNMDACCESLDMANHHESKASGLEDQLATSIYSDDADAIEQLEAKIAALEAERERWKKYNASCRKGTPDVSVLDEDQKKSLASTLRFGHVGKGGQVPGYTLQYIGAGIKRARDRIAHIKAMRQRTEAAEEAGGVVVMDCGGEWCRVTFAEKPERSIINALKAAGFYWGAGSWTGRTANLPDCVKELAEPEAEEADAFSHNRKERP